MTLAETAALLAARDLLLDSRFGEPGSGLAALAIAVAQPGPGCPVPQELLR